MRIDVVGGTYVERCLEPHWNRLLGSGVRAASALAANGAPTCLHTVVGSAQHPDLVALSDALGFDVIVLAGEQTITFDYVHCLSDPRISPRADVIRRRELRVKGDLVLGYGMLDAQLTIDAESMIYDPQSPYTPEPFRAIGRATSRLAMLGNSREIQRLAGIPDVLEAARSVLRTEDADVIIVKAGLRGAYVISKAGTNHAPAYASDRAWTIGSGDVFAAVFAHFWGRLGRAADESADLASRAVALYAQYMAIPPLDLAKLFGPGIVPVSVREGVVYLAGPFFTLGQRWLIEEARRELTRAGLDVKSPLHDVGVGSGEKVAKADLELLEKSDRIFAVVDGNDPGTLFEIGYAVKLGLPVVVLAQNTSAEDLKMLVGTGCAVHDDFATAIAATLTA